MYRKKENKIDLKLLRRTSKACSCLFSSSYVTDASDRILRIYFQLKSYPAVFSSNFIHSRSNYGKLAAQNYGFGQTQIETKRAHKNLKKAVVLLGSVLFVPFTKSNLGCGVRAFEKLQRKAAIIMKSCL